MSVERRKLLESELARLVQFFRGQDPPPERIILFGSVAQGIVEEWTDLDLVVVQPTSLPFFERAARFFERFQPKVAMDVFIYTPEEFAGLVQASRFFQEEVLGKGRVIYERSPNLV